MYEPLFWMYRHNVWKYNFIIVEWNTEYRWNLIWVYKHCESSGFNREYDDRGPTVQEHLNKTMKTVKSRKIIEQTEQILIMCIQQSIQMWSRFNYNQYARQLK